MDDMAPELQLPGFRFHPTEEELIQFYLINMISGKYLPYDIIGLLNIYHHEPWELPGYAKIGEREWYFFVPRDRKHGNGGRPNRTTETGFWKATGSDRKIVTLSEPKRIIGLKKTLVFYKGRAPRGNKTDWVMNEYRLPDHHPLPKDIVLCKIYMKATSLKELEQRAAIEEKEMKKFGAMNSPSPESSMGSVSFSSKQQVLPVVMPAEHVILKAEDIEPSEDNKDENVREEKLSSSLKLPFGKDDLPELNVPKLLSLDWTQDSFWTQFNSPWLQNFTAYPDIMNF